jgi:putative (di)nucleoside polyphosphate hydrolase
MIVNADGGIFVGKRIDMPSDYWQMPQGGIDPDETAEMAVLREVIEEVGTDKVEIVDSIDDWLFYDLPDELIGKVWKGRFRGQQQKWFLLRFTGTDDDINIKTDHPEFSAWKWSDPDRLIPEIVPFKREIYQNILDRFKPVMEKM